MKGKGAKLVKQIISMISCVSRAKCMAIRSKTDAMKARLMVTTLTVLSKKKKFSISAISGKINEAIDGIFNHGGKDTDFSEEEVVTNNAIVLYNKNSGAATATATKISDDVDEDDKYPDLRHSLFDEEEEQELADLLDDPNSSMSAIDIVKNSKENAENFNLEDEIDQVADLFITKFHKRMRLQKLLSFKRYQQMMERSA
ncbi:hypothetical protein CDL12_15251 [Handroanthus impetiginosus]|uniref:Uncharacterized protein n=1 Tax=Handroanthus impetiginosus TaxID=429701 RepID=A0A2G9H3P7_9LAMI|nr:hypothetical protein CDL12_15251 [Handroanthus impetiginosus]